MQCIVLQMICCLMSHITTIKKQLRIIQPHLSSLQCLFMFQILSQVLPQV